MPVSLTVNDEMFGPLLGSLDKTSQCLLVLYHRPAVELLRVRLPHDHVHEVLVAAESVSVAHQRKQLGAVLDFDGSWENVAIAVLSLSCNEQIAGDLVVFDPDVNSAHDLPFVDWSHFLVESAEVPRSFDALFRNIPESTSPW